MKSRRRDIVGLAAFLALCFAISAIGGAVTARTVGGWYQTLQKPSFNPPDWIFGPVWTALYAMMAVAAWRIWRIGGLRNTAMTLFGVQLALNLAWSFFFFGFQRIGFGLADIVLLLLAIVATIIAFWKRDRFAGLLLVPYAAWVGFATLLNATIWRLN